MDFLAQIASRFEGEAEVGQIHIRAVPPRGFDDPNRHDRAFGTSVSKWRVIFESKVPFEPNDSSDRFRSQWIRHDRKKQSSCMGRAPLHHPYLSTLRKMEKTTADRR